ncbi:MAG: type II/IV secretion system ATPase subunit [archaeon]
MHSYPLVPKFAQAKIYPERSHYLVEEPKLTDWDKKTIDQIKEAVVELTEINLLAIKDANSARQQLNSEIMRIVGELGLAIPKERMDMYLYYLFRDFTGLGIIEPLMQDPFIEDISCDGLKIPIFINHRDFGTLKTNLHFDDEDALNSFVVMVSQRCNRYISVAEPLMDGRLPDGSRVQASYGNEVTTRGSTFTIRKFRKKPLTPSHLVSSGMLDTEMLAYLWEAIENRSSILICGGTATGKTTLLNTLSLFIPKEMKIVSIEDTRELNLPHTNWVPATSRTGFGPPDESGRKYGEVSMFDLLKESFRERPDYVIVGEVRGEEASVLFQGMASGHASMGTMHADSLDSAIQRLTTSPINLSADLVSVLDIAIIVEQSRIKNKWARRVKEIDEVEAIDQKSGKPIFQDVYRWSPVSDTFDSGRESRLIRKLASKKGVTDSEIKKELKRKKEALEKMFSRGDLEFVEFAKLLDKYRKGTLDRHLSMEEVHTQAK